MGPLYDLYLRTLTRSALGVGNRSVLLKRHVTFVNTGLLNNGLSSTRERVSSPDIKVVVVVMMVRDT